MNREAALAIHDDLLKNLEAINDTELSVVGERENSEGWQFRVAPTANPDGLDGFFTFVFGDGITAVSAEPFITEDEGPEVNPRGPHSTKGLTPMPIDFSGQPPQFPGADVPQR